MAVMINGNTLLTKMPVGKEGEIAQINGGREMVRRLEAVGLRPGKKIKKVSAVFSKGPVILDMDGRMIAVGHGQADRIFISED